jgi:biotin synthase-related radical SAM superfamily protein
MVEIAVHLVPMVLQKHVLAHIIVLLAAPCQDHGVIQVITHVVVCVRQIRRMMHMKTET